MTDAFINYSRADRDLANRIARSLESQGISVFSDRKIQPGETFVEVIQDAIRAASCVITIWSRESVKSEWVHAEAEFAMREGKLLPIALGEDVAIPLGFRSLQNLFVGDSDLADSKWLEQLGQRVLDFIQTIARTPKQVEPSKGLDWPPGVVTEAGKATDRIDAEIVGAPRKRAFVSYADEDEPLAIELVKYLESSGCLCWISFRDVDPGEDYRASITKAMNEIAFLVLVYSEHVNTSFDIATELILARRRNRRRFVLRTDDTEPAGPVEYELATVQWVDCRSNREKAFERIAQRSAMLKA